MCALREIELRRAQPKLEFSLFYHPFIPEQLPWIISTLAMGVVALYQVGTPTPPRTRGAPYQCANEQHCIYSGESSGKMYAPKECSCVRRRRKVLSPRRKLLRKEQWGEKPRPRDKSGPRKDSRPSASIPVFPTQSILQGIFPIGRGNFMGDCETAGAKP